MIIGLSGKQRAGKDRAGAFIAEKYGGRTLALAQPLKQAAELIWGPMEKGPQARARWQALGTKVREIDDFVWIEAWVRGALVTPWIMTNRTPVICTDVRMWNEMRVLQILGGVVIRLEVTEEQQIERGANMDLAKHRSETELDGSPFFDLVIPPLPAKEVDRLLMQFLAQRCNLAPNPRYAVETPDDAPILSA